MHWLGNMILMLPILIPSVCLLAQTEQVPLPGSAGWVGTGLLGLVLSWVFGVHLPAKDKLIKEMMESKDAMAKELRLDYREALKIVVDGIVQETRYQTSAINEMRQVMQASSGPIGFEARQVAQQRLLQESVGGKP